METISPRKIFKSVSSCEHVEKLMRGEIVLRSIEFFRSNPCQDLKDFNEFSASRKGHSIGLTNPALIFCSHKFKPRFKNHLIEINIPCDLFTAIKEKLSSALGSSFFGEVIYTYPDSPEYFPINFYCDKVYLTNDINLEEDIGIEIAFYKDSKFSYENEVRMCFLVCPEKLNNLNEIEINFYERYLDPCLIEWKDRKIDYSCWKSKKKPPADIYDRYWFEVCFNLPQTVYDNFHNISHQS